MKSVLGHTSDELAHAFAREGLEPYRARQVLHWIFRRGIFDFEAMTDLGLELRRSLAASWAVHSLKREAVHLSNDGTRKLVLSTDDGAAIESVVIPEARRQTLCVSSQVGCSLDCTFCATGRLGLGRNLRVDEIVDQIVHGADVIQAQKGELSHIVFMGMGEPLLNLTHVLGAIRVLTDPKAGEFSPRRITVSTAGVVPKIEELGREARVRLAISLHAATDSIRDELVPLNRRFPIASLLEACRRYPASRRDRISFEYAMIRDTNDRLEDARNLAMLLRGMHAKVNLIPLNEHPGTSYRRSEDSQIQAFADTLAAAGLTATVRRSRGDDIFAACGQLGHLTPTDGAAAVR